MPSQTVRLYQGDKCMINRLLYYRINVYYYFPFRCHHMSLTVVHKLCKHLFSLLSLPAEPGHWHRDAHLANTSFLFCHCQLTSGYTLSKHLFSLLSLPAEPGHWHRDTLLANTSFLFCHCQLTSGYTLSKHLFCHCLLNQATDIRIHT